MITRYKNISVTYLKVDIWALGCVLYHLTALEPPFYGDNLITLGYNIVHKSPKLKFLEKSPSARPKLSDALSQFPSRYQITMKGNQIGSL
jgi:NIMA (never in mitosis gene a)-related kinase